MAAHIAIVGSGGAEAAAGEIKICIGDADIQPPTDRLTEWPSEKRWFLLGVITRVGEVSRLDR